ncbi:hypothetical protein RJ641_000763 [Dillenia turbinata]|uniref:Uncharacterized protein n=1 Tax=Dillenia turbinata TaxID=194707 RepID=A0AAN8W8T0_9MAGN
MVDLELEMDEAYLQMTFPALSEECLAYVYWQIRLIWKPRLLLFSVVIFFREADVIYGGLGIFSSFLLLARF